MAHSIPVLITGLFELALAVLAIASPATFNALITHVFSSLLKVSPISFSSSALACGGTLLLGLGTAHVHGANTNPRIAASFMCESSAMVIGLLASSFLAPTSDAPALRGLALVMLPMTLWGYYEFFILKGKDRALSAKPAKTKL